MEMTCVDGFKDGFKDVVFNCIIYVLGMFLTYVYFPVMKCIFSMWLYEDESDSSEEVKKIITKNRLKECVLDKSFGNESLNESVNESKEEPKEESLNEPTLVHAVVEDRIVHRT